MYVHYTATTPTVHNRISRLVANGDVSTGAETVLVDLPTLSSSLIHNGGAIHFGPDGKLYVAVGDNGTAPTRRTSLVFGKILRFNDDGTIPTDNPFYGSQTGLARAVWAYGLRNPFTFAFQPGTGRMHINDVGEATWEEINLGAAGANYGWPASEGPDHVTAGITAPLFTYNHHRRHPARVGSRRVPGRRGGRRRRVLSGQRQLPGGVPQQLLLRRLPSCTGSDGSTR